MRIAHVRGVTEKPSNKSTFDLKVQQLKKQFIIEHNRKFERERHKQAQQVLTN